jgi:hypothetical protein
MEPADISVLVCNYCTRTNIRPLGNSLLFYFVFYFKEFPPPPSSSYPLIIFIFQMKGNEREREREKNGAPGLLINDNQRSHTEGAHTAGFDLGSLVYDSLSSLSPRFISFDWTQIRPIPAELLPFTVPTKYPGCPCPLPFSCPSKK